MAQKTAVPFETEVAFNPEIPDVRTFRVRGRVTYPHAADLRKRILDQVDRASESRMVISLGGVEQMDTAGAAVLVEALMRGRERGLRILLCTPSPSVVSMFELADLQQVLENCCTDPAETKRRLLG